MTDMSGRLQTLGFTPFVDYVLQDDGEGPYIRDWTSELPQPSMAELEAAVPPIETSRATKLAAIVRRVAAKLAAGAPVGGLHVALDDGSRADMTAMGTTAIAAASGALPWPDSYSQGWITVENIRIPLPTPADGLGLAATVGNHYAQIRQHGRDLKDLTEAATTLADLGAIDETAGWPD